MAKVAISKQENYRPKEVRLKLEEVLSSSGILDLARGKTVLIKPNCTGAFRPEEGRTAHPQVLHGTIELLQSAGAAVKIGESSSVGIDTMEAYQVTGIAQVAKDLSVELVDFKRSQYREVKIDGGLVLDRIYLPQEVFESDCVFSLAKLKTNYVSGISCSIKNLKGLLPDSDKKKFHHLGIAPALVDLMRSLPRTVGLVDGVLGSELYEPVKGNVLAASLDLVALDYLCARIMGLDPDLAGHLQLALKVNGWPEVHGWPEVNDWAGQNSGCQIVGESPSLVCRKFKSQSPGFKDLEHEYQVTIRYGLACSSCLGALYLSLKKARARVPEYLAGREIVLGAYEGRTAPQALYFGNCAAKLCPDQNHFVPGCVPTAADFISGLLCLDKKPDPENITGN